MASKIRTTGIGDMQRITSWLDYETKREFLAMTGRLWSASDRVTVPGTGAVYYDLYVPEGTIANFNSRIMTSSGAAVQVDLLAGATFTPGGTNIPSFNLDTSVAGSSDSVIQRGATGVSGGTVVERTDIPVGGGNQGGLITSAAALRRFHGEGRALIRVTNSSVTAATFTINWTWFEQEES